MLVGRGISCIAELVLSENREERCRDRKGTRRRRWRGRQDPAHLTPSPNGTRVSERGRPT